MERNAGPRGDTCRSARAGPGVGGPLRLWQQSGDSLWVEGAQSRKLRTPRMHNTPNKCNGCLFITRSPSIRGSALLNYFSNSRHHFSSVYL